MKKIYLPILCCALVFGTSSCSLMQWAVLSDPNASNTEKGAVVGATSGASTGAFIGSLIGHGPHDRSNNSLLGAVVGMAAGAALGAAVGSDMDKQNQQTVQQSNAYDENYVQGDNTRYYTSNDNTVRFKQNKVSLTGDAKKQLNEIANRLKSDPTLVAEIYGHTDNSSDYNTRRRLSVERASEVKGYLLKKGVNPNQLYSQGCADQYPVANNSTDEGRAQNRRVEIVLTHATSDDNTTTTTTTSTEAPTATPTVDNSTAIR